MVLSVYFLQGIFGDWLQLSSFERIGSLLVCVSAGITVYFVVCFMLGLRFRSLRQIRHLDL